MSDTPHTPDKRPSFWRALLDIFGLSVLFAWLPIAGPFVAGFIGGRRARYAPIAIAAAILPAVLWWLFLIWASRQELHLGGWNGNVDQLRPLGMATALAIFGGALAGVPGHPYKMAGSVALVLSVLFFAPAVQEVWKIYKLTRTASYEPSKNVTCPDHLQKLYRAVMEYASSWDDTLPPADRWMTALNDPVERRVEEEELRCPDVAKSGPKYGYAMNPEVGGKRLDEIKEKGTTPLFYDSTDLSKDAHANAASLPKPGRHTGRNNVAYMDGQVKAVAPQ
jgi:prepilin-type processing-associated H-X9-DG protein